MAPLVVAALALDGTTARAQGTQSTAEAIPAAVTALADEYMAALNLAAPELGSFRGFDDARHDLLSDNSQAAVAAWQEREDAWFEQVEAIDPVGLEGQPELITYGYLHNILSSAIERRVCREQLWGVNQTSGWQVTYPAIAQLQPIGTPKAREDALDRWRAFPQFIDTEIANLRSGMAQGYTAYRGTVERVIVQQRGLLESTPDESPYFSPAARDGDPEFQSLFRALVANGIHPALDRYVTFLEDEYLPNSRSIASLNAIPEGDACYRASLRHFTTLPLDPAEVHELGRAQLADIQEQMQRIADDHFEGNRRNAFAWAQQQPQYRFETRQDMIDFAEAQIRRTAAEMPKWFGTLAQSDVIVESFPEYQEASAPGGQYIAPSADGSRPGRYMLKTNNPERRTGLTLESLTFHEAIPGHHWQLAIASERPTAHQITRAFTTSAFAEGWALYAESLMDEAGMYTSEAARMAALGSQMFRAARLVLDTGIHYKGWTRQEALDFMAEALGGGPGANEVDRYIAWPGQATSYMVGKLEIVRLRAEAEEALGDDFDIRSFHDELLKDGTVTLPMLRDKVAVWLARN